jgi:hypothetical protein
MPDTAHLLAFAAVAASGAGVGVGVGLVVRGVVG